MSIHTRIPWKKLNLTSSYAILRNFIDLQVLEMAGRKTRRKAQMNAKRYAFPTKASRYTNIVVT